MVKTTGAQVPDETGSRAINAGRYAVGYCQIVTGSGLGKTE